MVNPVKHPSLVLVLVWLSLAALPWLPVAAAAQELAGYIGGEVRAFAYGPRQARQARESRHTASFVVRPEFYFESDDGEQSFLFVPFARVDSADSNRSHVDIREALWQRVGEDWELRAGLGKVFWGVTESRHLVDVINQADLVENLDGEDKLGQPMLNLSLIRDWGTVDLFALPGFRERTYPGASGRLRTALVVDGDGATYQSSAQQRHIDLAARWSHVIGSLDVGLSHFWGTSRDPTFSLRSGGRAAPVLVPHYDLVHQTGLDVQATTDNWLWKLEAIRRSGQNDTFFAASGGFEYTFVSVGVGGTDADLGVLAEYHYDDRGDAAGQPFEDDVFIGFRLAMNDAASSELLAGVIHDREGDADAFSVEASTRIGDRWKVELEARAWRGVATTDPMFGLRDDDYIQFTVLRYF